MSGSAHVTSIQALEALRAALANFDADARDAISLLVLEVRRAVDWLENDRMRYWPEQVRKASQRVVEARNELERAELTYGSEEKPSCLEQKKALERAKRRLRLCEEKVRRVRHWVRVIRDELNEFDGRVARLNNVLDADLPRAIAALERLVMALEQYTRTALPSGTLPRPAGSSAADRSDDAPPPEQQGGG